MAFSNTGTAAQTMTAGDISDPSYYFSVIPSAKEMAAVFYTAEEGSLTYLLVQNFVNEGGAWKLNGFTIGNYAANGMTAPEVYTVTQELQEKGESVVAALYAQVLQGILQPANVIFYPNSQEMVNLINEVTEQANSEYSFPFTIETEQGDFEIINLQAGVYQERIACIISYVSPTPILEENKDAFHIEGEAIVDAIDEYIPGLTENFNLFHPAAYDELPTDENKEYQNYSYMIMK